MQLGLRQVLLQRNLQLPLIWLLTVATSAAEAPDRPCACLLL